MILLEKKKLWELPVSIRICDRTLYVLACRVSLSVPMIKCKKTADKKCRILAERRNT